MYTFAAATYFAVFCRWRSFCLHWKYVRNKINSDPSLVLGNITLLLGSVVCLGSRINSDPSYTDPDTTLLFLVCCINQPSSVASPEVVLIFRLCIPGRRRTSSFVGVCWDSVWQQRQSHPCTKLFSYFILFIYWCRWLTHTYIYWWEAIMSKVIVASS